MDESKGRTGARRASRDTSSTVRLSVLVVEDHPVHRQIECMILETLGCYVTVASDGLEALEASFALPAGDRRSRIAALRHFASRRSHYKQRRIWASVTNVRDGEELAACVSLGVPFMSGPAVCKPQLLPLGGRLVPRGRLPVGDTASMVSAV